MTEPRDEVRPEVLLSLQSALLGAVPETLPGVTCDWNRNEIKIDCYFGRGMSDIHTSTLLRFSDAVLSLPGPRFGAVAVCHAPVSGTTGGPPHSGHSERSRGRPDSNVL